MNRIQNLKVFRSLKASDIDEVSSKLLKDFQEAPLKLIGNKYFKQRIFPT